MGICVSAPDSQGKRMNDEIDRQLEVAKKQNQSEVKMLLLGAGESGKSTILKQMKIINEGGFNESEKRIYRGVIYSNLIQSMQQILAGMKLINQPLGDASLEPYARMIRESPDQWDGNTPLPEHLVDALRRLWRDEGVQVAYRKSGSEFHVHDSAKYFLDALDRICSPGYTPTDDDSLRCRQRTTGINETTFEIGYRTYRMFDVGGQRSERKKWIHCFENVTAIIFLVAISEYDQKLVEDESVNRMEEALTLFDSICNSRWFTKTNIILFLNKIDVFRDKIYDVPIEDYFPDYEGGDDYERGCKYFEERFSELNMNENKQVYTHFTCATDTRGIKVVMEAVQNTIQQNSLREAGLV